jgi:CheY-like chemotaxis protein
MSSTAGKGVPRGRVLVVEDEAYVRQSLSEILAERGYDIVEAGTVGEAVRVLAHAPIDVVLTDFRLRAQMAWPSSSRCKPIRRTCPWSC